MFPRIQTAPNTVPVTHDILLEKQEEVERLTRQANDAIEAVSRTINELEGINQRIDSAVDEIDSYIQSLTVTRDTMFRQRKNNAAIISNFSKLLETGETEQ